MFPSPTRFAALVTVVSVLTIGGALTTPSGAVAVPAAAPPAVASVTVDTQTQGPDHTWVIPVSWEASTGATGYTVTLTNSAGTTTYESRDVGGTSATLTTDHLTDGRTYKVVVVPFTGDEEGPDTWASFTAISLDRTPPTGGYTVSPTRVFLATDYVFELDELGPSAAVTITQTATPTDGSAGTITRQVVAGDGTAARSWTTGSTVVVRYTRAGVFTPAVRLTDGFGNAATLSLPPVTVAEDTAPPVVRTSLPKPALRDRIAGWRVVRGTARDAQTGVALVLAIVAQKRAGVWYVYDFGSHEWLKGFRRLSKSVNRSPAMPAFTGPDSNARWRTPRVRGLRTGRVAVIAFALDRADNAAEAPVVRHRITRR